MHLRSYPFCLVSQLTQQLVQVRSNDIKVLSRILSSQRNQKTLRANGINIVNCIQNEVQDSFFLKKILTIPKSFEPVLSLLVLCKAKVTRF